MPRILNIDRSHYAIGEIVKVSASSLPGCTLACDGSAVSRTVYARLFAVIGTTWGVGDGSTTFNLPDRRSRYDMNNGQGTLLSLRAIGNQVGSETESLTIANMPSHDHGATGATTGSAGGHAHTYQTVNTFTSSLPTQSPGGNYGANSNFSSGTMSSADGAHTHTFTSTSSGSGMITEQNVSPFLVLNCAIAYL